MFVKGTDAWHLKNEPGKVTVNHYKVYAMLQYIVLRLKIPYSYLYIMYLKDDIISY